MGEFFISTLFRTLGASLQSCIFTLFLQFFRRNPHGLFIPCHPKARVSDIIKKLFLSISDLMIVIAAEENLQRSGVSRSQQSKEEKS